MEPYTCVRSRMGYRILAIGSSERWVIVSGMQPKSGIAQTPRQLIDNLKRMDVATFRYRWPPQLTPLKAVRCQQLGEHHHYASGLSPITITTRM